MTHQGLTRYDEDDLVRRNERLPEHLRHDPAEAVLPPYYPDTRDVRVQVAAHYTQATIMDGRMGRILDQLKEDGLDDETIVFFFTDHGDGLPRGKRWLYEAGTRVPLIISFPEKYRHLAPGAPNTTVPRFVSFVDLAPTMLNLLGLPLPDYLQGKPFLGNGVASEAEPVYLFADRVGEVLDMTSLDLTAAKGTFAVEWFDTRDGASQTGDAVVGGNSISLVSPFGVDESVVHLTLQ